MASLRDRLLLGVNQIRILLTHTLQVFELFGEPRDLCINLVQAETVFGHVKESLHTCASAVLGISG